METDETPKPISTGSGVRTSVNGNEDFIGGIKTSRVVVAKTLVFESEVSVERSCISQKKDVSASEEGVFGTPKRMEGSLEEKEVIKKQLVIEDTGGGNEIVKEPGSPVGVSKNGKISDIKLSDNDKYLSGDGTSFLAEIQGSSDTEKDERSKLNRNCVSEDNRGNKIGKSQNASVTKERDEKNVSGEYAEEDKEAAIDIGISKSKYHFSLGDFVWSKIKSHPWWPGRIYDSSDASKYAAKYNQEDRLLVAYFGDGTFAWCNPDQLQPFEENFQELSTESTSKIFVNAVEKALDEFAKTVELQLACSCLSKENGGGSNRPLAINAGIKEGVYVPEGGIENHSVDKFEPLEFLDRLKYIAEFSSVINMLELTVTKSYLLAFYRAKGGFKLPLFHEPQAVPGLEDKNKNVESPIQGPFEEDCSPSKTSSTMPQKTPGISDNKLYQRKQKSIVELMGGEMDSDLENKEGTDWGQVALTSLKKKRKTSDDETLNCGGSNWSSSSENKRKKRSQLSVGKEDTKGSLSSEKKKNKEALDVENDNNGGKTDKDEGKTPMSRERKKSKYLSPPYTTSITNTNMRLSGISELETEMENPRIGERMAKAASNIKGASPICTETPKSEKKLTVDPKEVEASAKNVLSEFRSAAVYPFAKSKSLENISGFLLIFRCSVYSDGINYKMYNKWLDAQSGEKKKSLEVKSGSSDVRKNVRGSKGKESKTQSNKRRKSMDSKSMSSEVRKNANGSEEKIEPKAALFLTFGPGQSLPPKDDIIGIFKQFGALNESETEVYYNSFCARVVFLTSSDAKEALKKSQKNSPFGNGNVSYSLRYYSAATNTYVLDESLLPKASFTLKKCNGGGEDDMSPLVIIRKNLDGIMAVLEKSEGKLAEEMKSSLEGDVKGLLKKVSEMDVSTS